MAIKEKVDRIRARYPFVDHLVRMQEHIGEVKAGQQAGAVTYFGFISVFPILALAFAVMGFVARINPVPDIDIMQVLENAIESILPGIPTEGIVEAADENAPGIASVGLLVVLYSGLGWLSAMRNGLLVVFKLPQEEQPNFFLGKARDLVSLAVIGLTMLITVAVAGAVSVASEWILGFVPFLGGHDWPIEAVAALVGLLANVVLFYAIFRLLARPELPPKSLWTGALLGAVGFEILKQLAFILIPATKSQPAFQVFGLALILVVWINYFARILMYAAAFAYTGPAARAQRLAQQGAHGYDGEYDEDAALTLDEIERAGRAADHRPGGTRGRMALLGTGVALGAAGATAVLKREKKET